LTPPASTADAAAAADDRSARTPVGAEGPAWRKRVRRRRCWGRGQEEERGRMVKVEEMAAGATGSVAMARARARRQQRAVRISGRMAAAAAAFLCAGEESERVEDDEHSREQIRA
jgi:hypothetical protein